LSGCEKKIVSPNKEQVQIDNNVPVKLEINNSFEKEDKSREAVIPDGVAKAVKVGIKLKYDSSKYDRIVYVDQDSTELCFMKVAIIGIEGLNQLESLETIAFVNSSGLYDFSFLADVPQLKRLFIDWAVKNIDWNFIEQLPALEVLHVESYHLLDNGNYHQPTINIDLKNNKHLEYIGFESGFLETFPTLINVPNSLKYLNLQGNKITSFPTDFNKYNSITVFMNINPLERDKPIPNNVTVEWASNILEQKYCMPTNIPFISDFSD